MTAFCDLIDNTPFVVLDAIGYSRILLKWRENEIMILEYDSETDSLAWVSDEDIQINPTRKVQKVKLSSDLLAKEPTS